jgi:subtilase family serine protease
MNSKLLFAIVTIVAIVSPPPAMGSQRVTGSVPETVARLKLQPTGRLAETNRLRLAIGLPLRNKDTLAELLSQLYDPASANYRRYLTPRQFTEMFAPTEKEYQAVLQFAQANNFEISRTHGNRLLLDVSGKVSDIERAFDIVIQTYKHPIEDREFYAPATDPLVNLSVPLLQIDGLNNYVMAGPMLKMGSASPVAASGSGSGPNGVFTGKDFRNAYAPGVTQDGSGQRIGLVEFAGYYASDIIAYEHQSGFPQAPLINVSVDGASLAPDSGGECPGDIEMVISMATNLAGVVVFEAADQDSTATWNDMLNLMASSNQIKQFSCSWRLPSLTTSNAVGDEILQEMGAQGQSFFKASGDGDAYVYPIQWPNDNPWITTVGGTTLTMNGAGASYGSETVWNAGYLGNAWGGNGDSGYWGSGGGVSTTYSIPSYQKNVSMTLNSGSTVMRNLPDVAMVAQHIGIIYDNGQSGSYQGTSFASPLWAGFMALVNQQAAKEGLPSVGFANPALYSIGRGTNYTACFHDITTGNNTWSESPSDYFAVAGYDLCTGWGSPNGSNLIHALISELYLSVKPSITPSAISGGKLKVTGADGPPGAGYTLLTSTNLDTPLTDWKTSTTGVFSVSGTYTNIIDVNAADPERFFLLRVP